ncbi:MAG: hypothetical protein ACRDIC_08795, partial [bacterium]
SVAGRAYHLLNVLSAHTGATAPLWAIETHRRQFWIQRGKLFSTDEVQKYLDLIRASSEGAGRFAAAAQVPVDEYADRYPGMSVKVSGAM